MSEHEDDFAKVVRASDGAQVLFYTRPDGDDHELNCVTSYKGTLSETCLGFEDVEGKTSEEIAREAFEKAVADPDRFRDKAVETLSGLTEDKDK